MEANPIQKYETVKEGIYKVYVPVKVIYDADGNMHPIELVWEDGTVYPIDRVKKIARSAALKAGGQGDRYEILINGRISYLFYEHNPDMGSVLPGKWFTERKSPENRQGR